MTSFIANLLVYFAVRYTHLNFPADLLIDWVHWNIDPEKFSVQT